MNCPWAWVHFAVSQSEVVVDQMRSVAASSSAVSWYVLNALNFGGLVDEVQDAGTEFGTRARGLARHPARAGAVVRSAAGEVRRERIAPLVAWG